MRPGRLDSFYRQGAFFERKTPDVHVSGEPNWKGVRDEALDKPWIGMDRNLSREKRRA